MATSETNICNLALYHLGNSKRIASLTERSAEAQACNTFFEITRDKVLSDASWPFATEFALLGLVEENPNSEWTFSYRYPSNCLFFRRILSGVRNDTETTAIVYKVGRDSTGKLIFTDQDSAECEYTLQVTDPEEFSAEFVLAFSFLLAAYIAPSLTGGDPFKRQAVCFELYAQHIANAKSSSFNEEQNDPRPESEFVSGRE